MKGRLILSILLFSVAISNAQEVTVVDQDFYKAMQLATQTNKLVFINFYKPPQYGPSTEEYVYVFKNDSLQQWLTDKDFILLKYNFKRDSIFNLVKKYHINGCPTSIVLNGNGNLINKLHGYPAGDYPLNINIKEFTDETLKLNKERYYLKGYSNTIDINKYPKFYNDYIDGRINDIDSTELNNYLEDTAHKFSEGYFATLCYFSNKNISDKVIINLKENKETYKELYGEAEVFYLFYNIAVTKLENAIEEQNQFVFNKGEKFLLETLGEQYREVIDVYKKIFDERINRRKNQ